MNEKRSGRRFEKRFFAVFGTKWCGLQRKRGSDQLTDCSEPLDQKLIFRSADKISHGALGILRVFKACGPTCFDAVQQPCHVAAQLLHYGAARHPAAPARHWSRAPWPSRSRSPAACGRTAGTLPAGPAWWWCRRGGPSSRWRRLVGQISAARVGKAVHEAGHVAGCGCIVHRAAEHEPSAVLAFSMASLTTPPNTQPLPAAQPPQPMQPPTGLPPTCRISVSTPASFSSLQ